MLQPERMRYVQMLAKREDAKELIEKLAELRLLHVQDHERQTVGKTEIDIGEPEADAEALSDALTKTRQLLHSLQPGKGRDVQTDVPGRIAIVRAIAERMEEHQRALSEAEQKLRENRERTDFLASIPDPGSPIESLFATKRVRTYLVKRQHLDVSPVFLTTNDRYMLVTVSQEKDMRRFDPIDMSRLRGVTGTKEEALASLGREQNVLERTIEREQRALDGLGEHVPFLRETERVLALALLKAQAPLRFGSTRRLCLIRGYVPESRAHELEGLAAAYTATPARDAPTKLKNPQAVQSFEALMRLYTLPRYNEIDPTSLMAFTFPLFFGFMLGDIGYGLALLGIFLWIRHVWPRTKQFAQIVIVSALSTVAFGTLYGEFFGMEQLGGLHLPSLIHRAENIETMFLIAILFGIAHINIGLLFGMRNVAREHDWLHALAGKGGWMLLQVAAVMLAGSYGLLAWQPPAAIGWTLLALSVGGIAFAERLQGIMELPMIFSHTLSYLRLVAIGLASVYLAVVTNQLGGQVVQHGILWAPAGVLVVLTGHTINLALGLLGPFLHSLRLHYAEFFMKFYTGGGKPFLPFGEVHT